MNAEEREMIDVVDENNNIIGDAPREGIHNTKLKHRSVHIFLFDTKGNLWLEKRSSNTDTFPGYYNSSAAGHVRKGESYLEGANREIEEELGLKDTNPESVHMLEASDATENEFVAFFIVRSALKPKVHEYTDKLLLFSLPEVDRLIGSGEKFVPIFISLYRWYKNNINTKESGT